MNWSDEANFDKENERKVSLHFAVWLPDLWHIFKIVVKEITWL